MREKRRKTARPSTPTRRTGSRSRCRKEFDTLEEHVDFLIHSGKPTRAQEVAKAYYDANLTSTRGYKLYAESLIAGNKGSEALDVAEQVIAANSGDAAGHALRGRALLLLEKNEEGVEALRRAVQIDGEKAEYQLQLGLGLIKIGNNDDAALKFRAALKRTPDDPVVHVYLGMALRNQGELEESKRVLEKAIELDPQNGRAYFELGLLYNVQQNQGEGRSRAREGGPEVAERIEVLVRARRDLSAAVALRQGDQGLQAGDRARPALPEGDRQARPALRRRQEVRRRRSIADPRSVATPRTPSTTSISGWSTRRRGRRRARSTTMKVPRPRAQERPGHPACEGSDRRAQAALVRCARRTSVILTDRPFGC